MCWDDDRGLAVGRQTPDAVLRHQTSQSRISLSCLLALSVTHTHIVIMHAHTNTTTHIFSDLAAKTQRLGRTNTHISSHIHTDIYPGTKKSWIQFRQLLLKPSLWDRRTGYTCGLKIIQIFFPTLPPNPSTMSLCIATDKFHNKIVCIVHTERWHVALCKEGLSGLVDLVLPAWQYLALINSWLIQKLALIVNIFETVFLLLLYSTC